MAVFEGRSAVSRQSADGPLENSVGGEPPAVAAGLESGVWTLDSPPVSRRLCQPAVTGADSG